MRRRGAGARVSGALFCIQGPGMLMIGSARGGTVSPTQTTAHMMHTTIKDFPARLEGFLAEKIGAPVRIAGLVRLTGGASRDTWSVDVETADGKQGLIVRRDPGGQIVEEALSREGECIVLQRAFDAGVRVPRPRWSCMDSAVLGSPFFVMDRLQGESVGRRIVRDPALAFARQLLPAQMGEQL